MRLIPWLAALLSLSQYSGCAYLGHPKIISSGDWTTPIIHTSRDRERWYITADTQTLGERVFFFDTGYSTSTCDDDFIHELGIQPTGKVRIHGEAGEFFAQKAKLPPFQLGPHQVNVLWCIVRDLNTTSSIRDSRSHKIAGVIGADVVRRFDLIIRPQHSELSLGDRGSTNIDRRIPDRVRIRAEYVLGNRFRIPLKINQKTRWPIIDTGASESYIDGRRFGISPSYVVENASLHGSGENGYVRKNLRFFQVETVSVAHRMLADMTFVDRPKPRWVSGLIGLNILRSFEQHYDFKRMNARFIPLQPNQESDSNNSTVR